MENVKFNKGIDAFAYEPAALQTCSCSEWVSVNSYPSDADTIVCADRQAYLDEVLDYMPTKHAIFIRALRNGPSILQFGGFRQLLSNCYLPVPLGWRDR